MSQNELFAEIQKAANDWVSLDTIAQKVGRSKQYLNNKVIPKMISLRLLERKIPSNPKSPDQMYKNNQ